MATVLTATGEEDSIQGGAGRLFIRSWHPKGKPRAVVAVVPGFNSHSGYYENAAQVLVRDRLAVYALDLRGRGLSEGKRFYVNSVKEYVEDVVAFMRRIEERERPGVPKFLLGHSAGGVIACLYALEHQEELAGLLCESIAYRVYEPDFALAMVKGLSRIAPHAHVLRLKNQHFSRDAEQVRAMDEDPLLGKETQPAKTVAELARADERLQREFSQILLPVFIAHGTGDRTTKPEGSEQLFHSASSPDKVLKLYAGHAHDLLNDEQREVVLRDIQEWIDVHLLTGRARAWPPPASTPQPAGAPSGH